MELKEIFKNLARHKKLLLLIIFLGVVCGIAVYFIPKNYTASGSFYIKRNVSESQNEVFTYEGYYAQQTAISYTNTAISLLESADIQTKALEKMNVEINGRSLAELRKVTKVVKSGPQLVTVTVKAKSRDESKLIWTSIANSFIETSNDINKNGDPNILVSKISMNPIINQSFTPFYLYPLCGGILSALLGIILISIKEYFS